MTKRSRHFRPKKSRIVHKILALGALIYTFVLVYVGVFQRDFLYFPTPVASSIQAAGAHPRFEEISVVTEDNVFLKGWYAPASSAPLTLVFFHGNADSLKSVAYLADPYIEAGYGYLIIEYRGYSGHDGSPTEQGLYADARAFIKKIIARGVSEDHLIFMGHSLGTGVATQMATEFRPKGLILLAPFLSIAEMAQVRFPFLPSKYLTWDRYDNAQKIKTLSLPLLLAVAGQDRVVPEQQGEDLFALAHEPKQLYIAEESGHSGLFAADLYPISLTWLQKLGTQEN